MSIEIPQSQHSADTAQLPAWGRINNMPEELQLEELDNFVGSYEEMANRAEYQLDDNSGVDEAKLDASIDAAIKGYLAQAGFVSPDDAETDEQREAYGVAYSAVNQALRSTKREWWGQPISDGTQGGVAIKVLRELIAFYRPDGRHRADDAPDTSDDGSSEVADEGASTDTDTEDVVDTPQENPEHTQEDYEAIAADYEQYAGLLASRDKWATASAKQQGRAFSLKSKERNQIRDDYHANVRTFGIAELEGQILDTDDDTTRNAKVIEYLFNEQAKLRELTTKKLNGTKVGKFVSFINKGNLGVRLAKGFGVGLVVGAGGALLLGAAGAVAGAGIAIGASRFVKGYSANDRHRGMNTAHEEFIDSNDPVRFEGVEGASLEKRFEYAADSYNESFREATKKEQVKRRKALAWGVGSVAVGAGLGYAISNIDTIQDARESLGNRVSGWFNGEAVVESDTPDAPDDSAAIDKDGDGIHNSDDIAPNNPDIGVVDFSEITRDARWIDQGEGGFQTLQELGVPKEKLEAVWADAGEHFAESDKAYLMEDGRYGWSEAGRLTNADITELAKAARRQGVVLDFALAS